MVAPRDSEGFSEPGSQPTAPGGSSSASQLRQPRRPVRDGLLLGMALGFAIWLPFMVFSSRFLADTVNALFAAVIVVTLFVAAVALLAYLFRHRLAARVFGNVQLSFAAVSEAAAEAVSAWPDQQRAAEATATAAREALAVTTWMMSRRALITALLGMAGSIVAMVGTVLLLKQTQALEDQNRKLDAQTALLERQNSILASEGLWELLWKAHYAPEPAIRLDAAIDLSHKGHVLSGVVLDGPSPPDNRFVQLREKPRFDDGEFDPTVALVTIPGRLGRAIGPQTFRSLDPVVAGMIEGSRIRNLSVDFFGTEKHEFRGLSFEQTLVGFTAPDRGANLCIGCSFTSTEVRVQEGRASFEACDFRDTRIWSGMGEVFIRHSRFDSLIGNLTWGRDRITDSYGYAALVDFHGWTGDHEWRSFNNSAIDHLLFRWDEREMEEVEDFLDRALHSSARIGRLYFVEEQGDEGESRLVILREPTARANAWNLTRAR